MELVPLLKRLSQATGVSGYEHQVRDLVSEAFAPLADEVRTDTLGNVIALKKGSGPEPRPSLMIATHMDEIGLIVSDMDKGFLYFDEVGGYDPRVLLGQEVTVHGRRDLPGVIGARPPHVLPPAERDKPIPMEKLMIDTGLTEAEVGELVRVGDLVTMRAEPVDLQGNMLTGKALDNRASVGAAAVCLDELGRLRHPCDVYAVITVQEEVSYAGAITGAYSLNPDVAVAVDVTFAKQPNTPDQSTYEMGKGPVVSLGPNFHPKIQQGFMDAAQAIEMDYQIEPEARPGGTDAFALQITREGIPTGQLAIPLRNMHTPVETVLVKDVERVGRLLAAFAARLDAQFLGSLTWDLGLDEEPPAGA